MGLLKKRVKADEFKKAVVQPTVQEQYPEQLPELPQPLPEQYQSSPPPQYIPQRLEPQQYPEPKPVEPIKLIKEDYITLGKDYLQKAYTCFELADNN